MSNAEKKTILILEDERPLLEIVQAKLEGSGFDVITARSVGQAIHFLDEIKHIDAIWLDHYLLGTEDGLDFLGKIKEGKFSHIPVFVVSNSASENTKSTYIRLGIHKYYVKSDYRLDEIVKDLREVLGIETEQESIS